MKRPFLWAHRGASACAPENTMAAFNAALESGADGLELDIHLSCDGIPVVIHDETLDRTTDGTGVVARTSWQQLQQLDAGSWFSSAYAGETIPLLEDVLSAFGDRLPLNLEIKEFHAGMKVLELLSRFSSANVVISSFNHGLLYRLRAKDETLPLAVLYEDGGWYDAVALAVQLRASAFHPRADLVTRPMISACHEAGLPVYVWTVDEPGTVRKLLRAGVDGFFTNTPERVKSASCIR